MASAKDCDVFPRAMLDAEYQKNFCLPWLVHFPDGHIVELETEETACLVQREWRLANGLHPTTGEETNASDR